MHAEACCTADVVNSVNRLPAMTHSDLVTGRWGWKTSSAEEETEGGGFEGKFS